MEVYRVNGGRVILIGIWEENLNFVDMHEMNARHLATIRRERRERTEWNWIGHVL